MFSLCFWQNLAPDSILGNRRGWFTPTSSLPRVVLHQCNIVEFHSHMVIYRGARGEENIINLMQFRRNSTFLVYSPPSLAAVKTFFGKLRGSPLAGRTAVCQLLLDISGCQHQQHVGIRKGGWRALRPCPCGKALWKPGRLIPSFLNFLRHKMLVLKAGRNIVDKKTLSKPW